MVYIIKLLNEREVQTLGSLIGAVIENREALKEIGIWITNTQFESLERLRPAIRCLIPIKKRNDYKEKGREEMFNEMEVQD